MQKMQDVMVDLMNPLLERMGGLEVQKKEVEVLKKEMGDLRTDIQGSFKALLGRVKEVMDERVEPRRVAPPVVQHL